MEKALTACKKQRAKLVIAKLDRLSRNLAFIATLMDSGVEFIAVDSPHANKLTIHKDPDFKKTHFKIAEAAKPVAKWLSEQFSRVLAEEQAEMAKMARPM